eukprot:TRINITY_DN5010_c0_g1_i1.p1 TRINITY_DN5010_c0_g1~~TRINITY_DN5010_c0_g1_i1.p1  ORF type:complete len:1604 (+),score=274.67 TRINITY_DN5010_c0_g1_i1:128-4813(+)
MQLELDRESLRYWKRQKDKEHVSLDLLLVWLDDTCLEVDKEKPCSFFQIFGPEQVIKVVAADEEQKATWFMTLRELLITNIARENATRQSNHHDLVNRRDLSFEFKFTKCLKSATYRGDWREGTIHGRGVLETPSTIYSGDWNYLLKSGYGQIVDQPTEANCQPSEARHSVWIYDKIFTDKDAQIEEIQDFSFPSFSSSKGDIFDIVDPELKKLVVFKKDSKIFTEGENISNLYLLKQGQISLERNNYQFIVLKAPLLLCKALIVQHNAALYTARTLSDVTEIWVVRNEDIEKATQRDPALSYKIYTYSTALMVKWISGRRNLHVTSTSEDDTRLSKDPRLCTLGGTSMTLSLAESVDGAKRGHRRCYSLDRDSTAPKNRLTNPYVSLYSEAPSATNSALSFSSSVISSNPCSMNSKGTLLSDSSPREYPKPGKCTPESPASIEENEEIRIIMEVDETQDLEYHRDLEYQSTPKLFNLDLPLNSSHKQIKRLPSARLNNLAILNKLFYQHFEISKQGTYIVDEYQCKNELLNARGTLYLTTKYLCFLGVHTLLNEESDNKKNKNVKEVLDLNFIENISMKGKSTILIKFNKKDATKFGESIKYLPSGHKLEYSFATTVRCREVIEGLEYLCRSDDDTGSTLTDEDQARVQSEMMEKYKKSDLPPLRKTIVRLPKTPSSIRLYGPLDPKLERFEANVGEGVYGVVTTTYPRISMKPEEREHQGDPICDKFCLERFENGVIAAVADGCNWGPKPRSAAEIASRTFVEYNKKHVFEAGLEMTTVAENLVKACSSAHAAILQSSPKAFDCGTTTLLGGCLLQIEEPEHHWAFVCVGVGDCKAYRISIQEGSVNVTDISRGSRGDKGALDQRDCGGRLGPFRKTQPDLRNFQAYFSYLKPGDFVMLCSDGVYDNLDPQNNGVKPKALGLPDVESWVDLPNADWENTVHEYNTKMRAEGSGEAKQWYQILEEAKHNYAMQLVGDTIREAVMRKLKKAAEKSLSTRASEKRSRRKNSKKRSVRNEKSPKKREKIEPTRLVKQESASRRDRQPGQQIEEVSRSRGQQIEEVTQRSRSQQIEEVSRSRSQQIEEVSRSRGQQIEEVTQRSRSQQIEEVSRSRGQQMEEVIMRSRGQQIEEVIMRSRNQRQSEEVTSSRSRDRTTEEVTSSRSRDRTAEEVTSLRSRGRPTEEARDRLVEEIKLTKSRSEVKSDGCETIGERTIKQDKSARSKSRSKKAPPVKKRLPKKGAPRQLSSEKSHVSSSSSVDELWSGSSTTSSTEEEEHKFGGDVISAKEISEAMISLCFEKTQKIRKYMEEHPDEVQPKDSYEYPGKVDHSLCLVLQAQQESFKEIRNFLKNVVTRLRHPLTGMFKDSPPGTNLFLGAKLISELSSARWFKGDPDDTAQRLLSFCHIRPYPTSASHQIETFNVELTYQFKVGEPILTAQDWTLLSSCSTKHYKSGQIVDPPFCNNNPASMYLIYNGECAVHTSDYSSVKQCYTTVGEFQYLRGSPDASQVITALGDVHLLVLEEKFLHNIFFQQIDLAARFFHYLTRILSTRFTDLLDSEFSD